VTLVTEVYPMMRILMAARAYGLRAIDGPCGAFRDGFDGKQVVHPRQIEITRDAFIRSDDEVAYAHRAVAAPRKPSVGVGSYFPENFGGRFSLKAVMPSRRSAVPTN
jgi:citrate lyase beta subunit